MVFPARSPLWWLDVAVVVRVAGNWLSPASSPIPVDLCPRRLRPVGRRHAGRDDRPCSRPGLSIAFSLGRNPPGPGVASGVGGALGDGDHAVWFAGYLGNGPPGETRTQTVGVGNPDRFERLGPPGWNYPAGACSSRPAPGGGLLATAHPGARQPGGRMRWIGSALLVF